MKWTGCVNSCAAPLAPGSAGTVRTGVEAQGLLEGEPVAIRPGEPKDGLCACLGEMGSAAGIGMRGAPGCRRQRVGLFCC